MSDKTKNVLVTGVARFLRSNSLSIPLREGHEVIGISIGKLENIHIVHSQLKYMNTRRVVHLLFWGMIQKIRHVQLIHVRPQLQANLP